MKGSDGAYYHEACVHELMATANAAKPNGVCVLGCVCLMYLCITHTCTFTLCVHELMATANDAKPIGMCVFVLCVLICVCWVVSV